MSNRTTPRVLLIVPYFGDYPPWMTHWRKNAARLEQHGYQFLFDEDEDGFRARVREVLGIDCPPMTGTGRIWNFRPAFGQLYASELDGFNYWGHTDFDCVYGRVERWVTPEVLSEVDILANHDDYISGPWTLYRNTPVVNQLFRATGEWRERMSGDDYAHGWAEKGFTEIVDRAHANGLIRRRYVKWQTRSQDDFDGLVLHPDGRLLEHGEERMMAHFRRVKQYPAGCVL